jgi:hypothetical protein
LAASKLKLDTVPCIELSHLTEAQKKAYIIADNKLALNSGWDDELLKLELESLKELDFDIDLIGFSADELDELFKVDKPKEVKDLSDTIGGSYEIVVELADEMEQEDLYNKLTEEGYICRVLTL